MSLEQQVKSYLISEPRARERRNKTRALCNLLQRTHPSIEKVNPEVLTNIFDELLTMDRHWRKILSENPSLRGQDYDGAGGFKSKRQLEEEKLVELNYEEGANLTLKI